MGQRGGGFVPFWPYPFIRSDVALFGVLLMLSKDCRRGGVEE